MRIQLVIQRWRCLVACSPTPVCSGPLRVPSPRRAKLLGTLRFWHQSYFYRYQPPTPAKELIAEFWKLEEEAEKILEGLANA